MQRGSKVDRQFPFSAEEEPHRLNRKQHKRM